MLKSRIDLLERQMLSVVGVINNHILNQEAAAITSGDPKELEHLEKSEPTVWASSAKLSLQQGIMFLRRAVDQPEEPSL